MTTTTLHYGLLGLLAKSSYGERELLLRIDPLWSASEEEVHLTVVSLLKEQSIHVKFTEEHNEETLFEITAHGQDKLANWMLLPVMTPLARDELLLKAYFLNYADSSAVALLFEEALRSYENKLQLYRKKLANLSTKVGWKEGEVPSPQHPWFHAYSLLKKGILVAEANLEWATWISHHASSSNKPI